MLRGHTELRDDRVAVLVFDQFTLILDAAATDSVAAIGFNSADCDTDFAAMVARGAIVAGVGSDDARCTEPPGLVGRFLESRYPASVRLGINRPSRS